MNWPTGRVKDASDLINGHPFDSTDFSDHGDLPLVRIRDILSKEFQTFVPRSQSPNEVLIRNNDIVIGMDGDFNSVLWSRGEAALNQRLCMLRTRPGHDARFLAYALPSHLREINELTYATTVKHLSSGQVSNIRLFLPPLAEQLAIADYLDRETAQIDTLIAKQEQLIATLRERRMAAISAAVAPNSGEPDAEDWFGSAPVEWHVASLKQHFEIALGKMINANMASSDEQPAPYLAAGSIQPDHLITDVTKTMTFTPSELAKYSLKFDDIVVVEGGAGYGRSHRLTRDLPGWGFQNHVARLRSSSALVSSRFAAYVLKACVASGYVEANNRTATLPSLSREVLGAIRFTYPHIDDQDQICDALDQQLDTSDGLIAKAERFIELSKERRAALITAAVTGQLDIPAQASAHS
ncbi:restriction endonuclease subunit S [Microbacterium sp.]|uniref:restriction endonuclease subunit S n=1 Tax=Microbacterium sp. TaxID=51671 RepID=UPI003A8D36E1